MLTQENMCHYTASTQPRFQKKSHVTSSLQTFQTEKEREEMVAEWLASPHLPLTNFLAPPTCLCTVTVVTVLEGPYTSYCWKDGGGGGDDKGISSILLSSPRKLCNHSTA